MNILAHRGLWNVISEKNSLKSLKLSLDENFGIETDLRDFDGSLVVSHDPVVIRDNILLFEDLLKVYKESRSKATLALNIKTDGIISEAEFLLNKYKIKNYFFFDMSIPELICSHKKNIKNIFCRNSEFESSEKVLHLSTGVWLDSFDGMHRNLKSLILNYLNKKKNIAIVSPELHVKDHKLMYNCWREIKDLNIPKDSKQLLMLCTDNPFIARDFFKDDN